MNRRWVLTVALKELSETFRDKTTLFIQYGLPLLLWPLTAVWFGELIAVQFEKLKVQDRKIAIVGTEIPIVMEQLFSHKQVKRVPLSDASRERALAAVASYFENRGKIADENKAARKDPIWRFIRDEKLHVLVAVHPDPSTSPVNHRLFVFYDQTELSSSYAANVTMEELVKARTTLVAERLKSRGIARELVTPLTLENEDVGETRKFGNLAGRLAPFIVLVLIALSTYYTAVHTVVGESERGTMPTLLSTPIGARELMTGKYLNIVLTAALSLGAHLLTSALCVWLTPKGDLSLPSIHQPYFLPIISFSAIVFMSGTTLFLANVARTAREANGIHSAFLLVIILPVALVAIAELSLNAWNAVIPLVNVALIIRGIFIDPIDPGHVVIAFLSNVACGVSIFALATHIFRREAILFRGEPGFADLFTLNRSLLKGPTPGLSILVFSTCLLASVYSNLGLAKSSVFFTVPFTQLFVFVLVPIVYARYFLLNWREVFLFRSARILTYLGAAIAGLGAAGLMIGAVALFPMPKQIMEEFAKQMRINDPSVGALTILLIFGIIPAICEEITFRGIILSGFRRRLSSFWSILITSAFFGLNHFSVYRFVPTAVGGVLLGWIACRSMSLFPAIVCHLVYNSSLLMLTKYPARFAWLGSGEAGLSTSALVAAAGLLAVGVGLVARSERR